MPSPIDQVVVQMYRMGTGDCFVVKFLTAGAVSFKMLIDCGTWSGSKAKLTPFVRRLMAEVENHVHLLVVTHEHKDHVFGFEQCRDLFTDGGFTADRIWMAWTEEDGDPKVEKWKRDHGQKKLALGIVADRLDQAARSRAFRNQFAGALGGMAMHRRKLAFAEVLRDFADLHANGTYVGDLEGLRIVKEEIADNNVEYLNPGEIKQNIPGLEGVRIYVLGPPELYDQVKTEGGPAGEAYEHNDDLADTDAFAAAVTAGADPGPEATLPFDRSYLSTRPADRAAYNQRDKAWRRIDYDWLFSAGAYALRMNSLTNNLSLVLAIEFVQSGKVLLFPGDAEFGSWKSWHGIEWGAQAPGLTTEQLLNRTVFYKVAHHLSHNGTARSIGLEMMTSPDLCAMATLDYDVISNGWKSTMPNVGILKDLFERTRGRTVIMNTTGLLFDRQAETPVDDKLEEYRQRMSAAEREKFNHSLDDSSDLFTALTITL
jgi:hypothetical protein